MLIDDVIVTFVAGQGGSGITSFGKKRHSGPDGGNGGKGGDIYLKAKSDIKLLNKFSRKKLFEADNGEAGRKNKQTGKNAEDLIITVPTGTSVIETHTGKTLFELNNSDQTELLCSGGMGGRGNYEFRSPTNTTPQKSEPGKKGETKEVRLLLKLIADYGLIGQPNAGKSSLLNEITNSKAVVANYPFTTLSPNLGVCGNKIIADIPGLIENASTGKGLGISFLKHIEKVRKVLHCISADSEDPIKDYKTVRSELIKYKSDLDDIDEVIIVTKSDLVDKLVLKNTKERLEKFNKNILTVSIHDWDSIQKLKNEIS